MITAQLPTEIALGSRLLTSAEFHRLADVPPEVEWFSNLSTWRDELRQHRLGGPTIRHRLAGCTSAWAFVTLTTGCCSTSGRRDATRREAGARRGRDAGNP